MTPPPEFYLDTNAASYLYPHHGSREASRIRSTLKRRISDGDLRLIGSFALFDELAGIAHRDPNRYWILAFFLTERVRGHILMPVLETSQRELQRGGLLEGRERFASVKLVNRVRATVRRRSAAMDVGDQMYADAQEFVASQEETFKVISNELHEKGIEPSKKGMELWWSRANELIDEWVRKHLESSRSRLGIADSAPLPPPSSVPTARRFYEFHMARLVRILGDGKKVEPGDAYDARHYAAACYSQFLVTDDKGFRRVIDLIPDVPFKLLRFTEFVDLLNRKG